MKASKTTHVLPSRDLDIKRVTALKESEYLAESMNYREFQHKAELKDSNAMTIPTMKGRWHSCHELIAG